MDTNPIRVPTLPDLLVREVVVALVLLAFILVFAMVFNAPLEGKANPGLSPNPTKAPWYFMGIQEMLMHFHPLFAIFITPILMIMVLLVIPYFNYQSNTAGVWFASQTGRVTASIAALTAAIVTPVGILADAYIIDVAAWMPGLPDVIGNGLIPFAAILVVCSGFYIFIKRKYKSTNNEAIQAVFALILVAFLISTVTGVWFRGPGMALSWPF
jgi:quinol-cytochrome oxidoreductase complex cytochrome b subunit